MNKYIRTKTGKICKVEITKIDKEHNLFNDREKDMSYIDDDVIKIADGIEELCDCAIEVTKDNKIIRWEYIESCKLYHQEGSTIFGAICFLGRKNEPIIKSVAKMKGVNADGSINWDTSIDWELL